MNKSPRGLAPAFLLLVLGSTLPWTGCSSGGADSFPARPMSIICPWSAGGGTSTVSQLMAALIEEETGQRCTVVHRTGGRGVTGHSSGALSSSDGHELTMMTVEIAMLRWSGLTEMGPDAFHPVTLVTRDAAALFVREDARWKTLAELRTEVTENPGKLKGSGTGQGGIWHVALAGGLLAMDLSSDAITWVPSGGSKPALQELLAGGVDVVVCSVPEAMTYLKNGAVRCLGLMNDERIEAYADVPTWKEQGIDYSLGGWRGIAVPRSVPPARAREVESLIQRIVKGDAFREKIEAMGYVYLVEDASTFAKTVERTDDLMRVVIPRALGMKGANREGIPGPLFFPALLAGGLGLLSVVFLFTRIREGQSVAGRDGVSWRLFLELVIAVGLYVAILEPVGFLPSSGALMLYLFRRLGSSWLQAVMVTAILVPGVHLFFSEFLRVDFPRGIVGW